ncbi:MAG: delta-class carbonic anhydrase [Pseudomonadota bacterium]
MNPTMVTASKTIAAALALSLVSATLALSNEADQATDADIAAQRAALAAATDGAGFGPQSPRDIDVLTGNNDRAKGLAPPHTALSLCNIHFHESAEHRGGDFTTYAGPGDGEGTGTGFVYDGTLSQTELAPLETPIGAGQHGDLTPGDTIEIHFVYSSAQVAPGPTLGACLTEAIANPQLRVETVVAVLVNDPAARDFTQMAAIRTVDGRAQVSALPGDLGPPVVYAGSTTGPSYNRAASPFHVTWSVRPRATKIDIASVGAWLADNPFDETGAHGVRNLVVNPDLLAPIEN